MTEAVITPPKIVPQTQIVDVKPIDVNAMLESGLKNIRANAGVVDTPVETPVATETPVETPVTTTETPAETITTSPDETPVDYESEVNNFFGKETTPATDVSRETATQSKPTDKELEYEALLKDPELKAILELKKAGKSIISAVSELRGVDPSALNDEQRIIEDCKRLGITDTDQIQQELDAFEAMTPRQQAQERNRINAMLADEQTKNLSKYAVDTVSSVTKIQETVDNNYNKLNQELDQIYAEKTDKNYFGIKTTPEILQSVKNEINQGLGLFNADGTYNSQAYFQLAYLKSQIGLIMKVNGKNGTHKGMGDVLAEVARPSKNETTAKPPVVSDPKTDPASVGEALVNEALNVRRFKQ